MRSFILLLKRTGLQKIVGVFIAVVLIITAGVYIFSQPKILDPKIQSQVDQSKYTETIPTVTEWLLTENPKDINAMEVLAASYIQKAEEEPADSQKNFVKALDILTQITKIDKNRDEAYRLKGVIYLDWNALEGAQKNFNKAISLNSENLNARAGLAMIYEKRNDWAAGYGAYNSILKINPDNDMANLGLARYYISQKDALEAYNYATKVASSSKNYSSLGEANHVIGSAFVTRNKYDKSIPYFEKSLTYRPGNVHTMVLLGESFVKMYETGPREDRATNISKATDIANKAIETKPDYIYAYALLYKINLLQLNYTESNKIAKQILELLKRDTVLSAAEKKTYAEYYKGNIASVTVKSIKTNENTK